MERSGAVRSRRERAVHRSDRQGRGRSEQGAAGAGPPAFQHGFDSGRRRRNRACCETLQLLDSPPLDCRGAADAAASGIAVVRELEERPLELCAPLGARRPAPLSARPVRLRSGTADAVGLPPAHRAGRRHCVCRTHASGAPEGSTASDGAHGTSRKRDRLSRHRGPGPVCAREPAVRRPVPPRLLRALQANRRLP